MRKKRGNNIKKNRKISLITKIFLFGFGVLVLGGTSVFYFTRDTRAAAGDFAIYREATGGESVTTTLTDQAWDTTVSEASLFAIDGGRTTVTLSEAGHYLAMYNIGTMVVSGTTQAETQGFIDVNGTQQAYGRSSCYLENLSGQTKCWMSGAAIINTTATNQTVKIQAQRTDDGTLSVQRSVGSSGFTLLRLDDSWAYARIREAGGGQTFNVATWATVSLDTSDELDTGYSHTAGAITLSDAGKYIVTTNVEFVSTAGAKNRLIATRLTLDGAELDGTRVTALMSGDSDSDNGVASFVGLIEATTTNQVLRLEGACLGEDCSKVENVANETAVTIVRLPDTVEVVGVTEAGGGQQVDTTADPITWDTNKYIDTVAFDHSTTSNTSRITVQENDDYLFFASFYNEHTTPAANILDPHWEWRVNGSSVLTYGSFSHINRGDDGRNGAPMSGASGGAIFTSLTTNDYIETINTDESTGTDADPTFQAYRMGLQGIRLSTLEVPDIVVSSDGTQFATTSIPSADFYVGGAFVFTAQNTFPTETITSVTITENGTIDAQNDVSNVRLYYDLDVSDPYNCVGESYDVGVDPQYGATSSAFSSANGTSTFTGSVIASTTQTVCMYVVLDVDDTATDGDKIDIEISNPSTDVLLGGGPVGPGTAVLIPNDTTLEDDFLTQIHYHWRNDDNTEALATSATLDTEDSVLVNLTKNNPKRIRLEVSNEGSGTSPSVQYRLEYATKTASCLLSTGWTDVDTTGDAWEMYNTNNLADGTDTTNIALATLGAVSDEEETFLTPNGAVKDASSQTGGLTATSGNFIEFEYSVQATNVAVDGESYCFRVTDAGTPLADYQAYPEVSIASDVIVSGLGTHIATVDASTSDFYIGGSFAVVDQAGSRDVTSVTIDEVGTVDALNNLSNIRLYYETDTNTPFNCAGETYDGNEEQYGATSSGFSAVDGSVTFTETVSISTTEALCLYPVLDVDHEALDGETIQIEITNPGAQVVVSSGTVNPNTPVGPTASTTILHASVEQKHYHWRYDTNTEALAPSATEGDEDTPISKVKKTETQRLRLELSNEGGTSTRASSYTLEYTERSGGSCEASGGWQQVGVPGGSWVMSDSIYLTHGNDTTNISTSTGGVTDENNTFLTPNSGILETSATSSALVLATTTFLELEYAIEATANASFGTTYCFRLVGETADVEVYDVYPQATIRQNQDYYIQRGETEIPNSVTSVTIEAGTDYVAPSATSSAFIRITNTMHTGAGNTTGGGTQNMDNTTTHISNPENITTSIDFTRTGNTGNTKIFWEIIEYTGPSGGDNEMIVRNVQAYTGGNKSLTENIAVSGIVDDADVVVFLTGQSSIEADALEYESGIVTTDWNGVTNEVVLERGAYGGAAGNPVTASFAVVEFTGSNWLIQRAEHTYTAIGTDETETIIDVNDLERAFIHTQHRTDQNTVADYGHTVWLSAVGAVSFRLDSNATSPGTHTSVAWVIENLQTNGTPMVVTRSNGTQTSGGTSPSTFSIAIGKTLSDMSVTSIFATMYSAGADTTHPRASMGVTLASTTHYELWISDTGADRSYRTEVVEWPTAVLSVKQNYYRFYVDNDALDPTDPWPVGVTDLGENTAITGLDSPPGDGERVRLRMSLNISGANISQGSVQYKMQYGVRSSSCSAVGSWFEIGDAASTTAVWRGYNATPLDGTALSTNPPTAGELNLSVSDRAGTYEEANPTAVNPYKIFIGEDVEYDWILEANGVTDLTSYCFRMVESDGGELEYIYYPTVTMAGFVVVQQDWEWFDDETSLTPNVSLAASNTSPINIPHNGALKLRVLLEETAGRDGDNTKFKLQWSESSNFSAVYDVDDIDTCAYGSVWCYFDGAGAEGATITANTLVGADTCVGGVGDGCGTHNELSYAPDVVGEVGTTTTDTSGTTVTLSHTYDDPVFIAESISGDATGGSGNDPAVAVITATSTNSFTVRIQEPDNEADDHGSETIAYIVMERGSYQLPDGRRVDVDTKDVTDYYGNAVAGTSDDTCSFTQTFSNTPVVLTSLQSNNNTGTPDFLTASMALVNANNFACSLEVSDGETNAPSSAETYGWIAIEGGVFANNTIFYEATTTSVSVTGWSDTPWYEQIFTQEFSNGPGIVATKQTRNGGEGGWVRYDNEDYNSVELALDERDDGERTHTNEQVGYIAFGSDGVIYRSGTSTFTFTAGAVSEFEFTIQHYDARPNQTYFFRLYDVERDKAVSTSSTSVPPSLSTEGATLTSSMNGISSGFVTEGETVDITTTATSVPFGSLTLGVTKVGAQRLSVSTNAPNGYQMLVYERQNLTSSGGATIQDISGTNLVPSEWASSCPGGSVSCYGYHTGDNTLAGGSTRFLLNDTYAAMTSTLEEVAYSSGPVVNEETDIVYKLEVSPTQPAGLYESSIVYVLVPVF